MVLRIPWTGPWGHKESDMTVRLHLVLVTLLLRRKGMTNLDNILKSRDITLSIKVCVVKAVVFLRSCLDMRVRV